MEGVHGRRRYLGELRKPAKYRGFIKGVQERVWQR